jgi:hypothetical protein
MRRHVSIAMGLFLGVMLTWSGVTPGEARQKEGQGPAAKQTRIDGTVQMIDKDAKTLTVRLRGKTNQRQVVYNDDTKFTYRNKPSSLDDVKDGRRVICLGQLNDKDQLIATRIDVRDQK